MSQSPWNPEQYERFRVERSKPFHDLLDLVRPRSDMRVIDLGCGTGQLTRVLHQRLHALETLGIDSSETMLAEAAPRSERRLRFEQGDIHEIDGESTYDLVFSNAALHWVEDHVPLFRRLTALLRPGGQLAVQVPANDNHTSHVVAREVVAREPFRSALDGYVRHSPVLAPEAYAELLDELGCEKQHVRLQVYAHHLTSRQEVIEWVRGSTLTVYQKLLSPALYDELLSRYRLELFERLPDRQPLFFSFRRILMWAMRPRD